MRAVQNLVGMKFGRLTVVEKDGMGSVTGAKWRCKCECGKETSVFGSNLVYGRSLSCGCLTRQATAAVLTKHGKSNTRIYGIWTNMKDRCLNPKAKAYGGYGGRGITVCEEWRNDFQSFYDWAVVNGYSDELTLERKNNDGNYCPENCRWATRKEQANNTRRNRMITIGEETHTLKEWTETTGVRYDKAKQRVAKLGWDAERALSV